MKPTYEELEAQVKQLAAELSADDAVHNEAVFITDDDYDKCPKRAQDIIRHLAVMQIPAYQSFVASLRTEAFNELCQAFVLYKDLAGLDDDDLMTVREATDAVLHCAELLSSQSDQVKGVQS